MNNLKIFIIINLILQSIFFLSCKSVPVSQLSQDDGISKIRESYKDQQWTDVINAVDQYKARYPYSRFNPEAELLQADAYFQADKFPEAIAAYEDFARKNPNDKNGAFAYYRIARSYDLQDPSVSAREQVNAEKALTKYKYYLANYPDTEWVSDAKDRVKVLTDRLAEQDAFVADFYWNQDLYAAALSRYLNILKNYSQYEDLKKEALERGADCYDELAKILEKDPQSDQYVYFIGNTPTDLRKKAEELRSKLK